MLTEKQRDLLLLIDKRVKADGVPPSYDEMKDHLGLASKSGIHRLITALEERGFIRRLPNKARALEVLKMPTDGANVEQLPVAANDSVQVPLVGKIAAGVPISAIQQDGNMFAVPDGMIGRGEHFALEVEGESMIEAGILDGDVVIIRKANTARNNEIVVALVDREEATLKRLHKSGNEIELIAENKDFPVRKFGPDRVEVQGVLVGLVRRYH
ncbi:MAG: transcriptional repressor LexA [Hellea sp.]|nr:transcriptional repressor LexA [Hellea sp.]